MHPGHGMALPVVGRALCGGRSGGVAAAPVMPGVRGAMIFRSGYERFDILTDQRRERAPYPRVNRPGLSEGSGLLLAFETGDLPQAQCGESGDPIPSSLATSGILRSRSSTSSIARRRSSSEYFLGLAMTQSPSPGPKAKERALHETRDGSSSPRSGCHSPVERTRFAPWSVRWARQVLNL